MIMTFASLVLALAACSDPAAPPAPAPAPEAPAAPAPPAGPRPSLVLLTLDTTRADHIGAYGHTLAETPTIDTFAREGLLFSRAYSVLPLTTPAHSSMMSGLYPTRHGIHNNGDAILPDEVLTLAEILKERQYSTAASVSAFVTTRIWNIDQGFDAYFDEVKMDQDRRSRGRWARERRAAEVVDDLIAWVNAQPAGQPIFIWGHFYDPHDPYEPPGEWKARFEQRPYDGEIAYMDAQIARLKAAVDARSTPDGTAWILVADHGEALAREHGEVTHGMYVFDPTMRIPFIVRPPTPLAAPVVERQETVSNVDVMPTALGLLGVPVPADLDGKDLTGFLKGAGGDRPPVYMEAESPRQRFGFAPEHAIADGPLKLIDTPNPRLFDVDADPKEEKNLVAERAADVARLRAVNAEVQGRRISGTGADASPEVVAQLQALGYMGGSAEPQDPNTPLLDAKDQKAIIEGLEQARVMAARGRPALAEKKYTEVLATHPQIAEARLGLSRALSQQRKFPEAEKVLRVALEREPTSTITKGALASNLAQQGRMDEALALSETVLQQVPGDDVARNQVLELLVGMGRPEEAIKRATAWRVDDPKNMAYEAWIGLALFAMRRYPESVPHLQASLADGMPRRGVRHSLAMLAYNGKRNEEALKHLETESADFPDDRRVRHDLAHLLLRMERWDEAVAELSTLSAMMPKVVDVRRLWAQAVFNTGDYPASREVLAPALKAAPDDPEVLLLQANILQKLGQGEEAKVVFERAKVLHKAALEARGGGVPAEDAAGIAPALPGAAEYQELQQYGIPR
jgi:arylsulfatase A-like enzyme/tetratricopeptide (TPR) repeat protein